MGDIVNLKESLVSVIMPSYNCEKYIEEAVQSVLNQTYSNWELIVIDDSSKDATVAKIRQISENDHRIRLMQNEENQGVAATRNRAVREAAGEWVAFLDSDDKWDGSKLEKQLKLALEIDAEFLFTGATYIDQYGEFYKGVFEVPNIVTYKRLLNQNLISCSSVLIKKRLLLNFESGMDDIHEDYAMWLSILRNGCVAYGVNEPLLIYRITKGSKSGNKLKSAKMNWKTLRFTGTGIFMSIYYMMRYMWASVNKYCGIMRADILITSRRK